MSESGNFLPNYDLPSNLPTFLPGSVWLVGAGPGDPGLLTVLALHGLRCADVIIYDALVSEDILSFVGLPQPDM